MVADLLVSDDNANNSIFTPLNYLKTSNDQHWPAKGMSKRCKNCQKKTMTKCTVCNVNLCILSQRSCYIQFHTNNK